jgi:hypothetical protein
MEGLRVDDRTYLRRRSNVQYTTSLHAVGSTGQNIFDPMSQYDPRNRKDVNSSYTAESRIINKTDFSFNNL